MIIYSCNTPAPHSSTSGKLFALRSCRTCENFWYNWSRYCSGHWDNTVHGLASEAALFYHTDFEATKGRPVFEQHRSHVCNEVSRCPLREATLSGCADQRHRRTHECDRLHCCLRSLSAVCCYDARNLHMLQITI